MNPGIYIKQADLNNFEKNINKILKAETDGKTKLLLSQAKLVQARIKEKAPLGPTGNLKKATYAIAYPETLSSSAVAFAGIRPKKAPHAHLVEYGHGGPHPAPPHPFIRPVRDEMMPKVRENIAKELGKIIEGAV